MERNLAVHIAGRRFRIFVNHHVQHDILQLRVEFRTPGRIVATLVNAVHTARRVLDLVGQVHLDGVNPRPLKVVEVAAGYLYEEVRVVKCTTVHTQLGARLVHTVDNQRNDEVQLTAVREVGGNIDVAARVNQRSVVTLTVGSLLVLNQFVDVYKVVLATDLGLDVEVGQLLLVGHRTMESHYILTAHGVDVELSRIARPKKITYLGVDTTYR